MCNLGRFSNLTRNFDRFSQVNLKKKLAGVVHITWVIIFIIWSAFLCPQIFITHCGSSALILNSTVRVVSGEVLRVCKCIAWRYGFN